MFNTKLAIFQRYHGKNKLHSMKWWWCPLCTRSTGRFGSLSHWNNSPRV